MALNETDEQINRRILDEICEYQTCFNRENCLKRFTVCPAQNAVFQSRKTRPQYSPLMPITGLN